MDQLVVLGKIASAHGARGELKVYSYTEPPDNLLDYGHWVLKRDGQQQAVRVVAGRVHGKALVVRLEGLGDRDLAQGYAGFLICVPSSQLPALPEGEFYWHQLLQLQVVDLQGRLLGRVDHLLETGANDVLVVRPCEGSVDKRERLLPYTSDCVKVVDLTAGQMQVDWDLDF